MGLMDDAALTGETELGLTGGDGQVLRALRVTAQMPVVLATRLQLSYAYHVGAHFSFGQVLRSAHPAGPHLGWVAECAIPSTPSLRLAGVPGLPYTAHR